MAKKVLLVAPSTKDDLFQHRWVTPNLGLWRIASFLGSRGYYCEVYDCNNPSNIVSFADLIKSSNWDIIGFSVLIATEEYDIAKIVETKKLSPDSLLIAGGNGAALNYQLLLDKTPIDMVVLAEGEYPLLDLCEEKSWQDIEGIVFRKHAKILTDEDYWEISKDLDVESMRAEKYWEKTASLYKEPNYDEINTFRLFTANYCPMGCAFCTLTLWKKHASGCHVPVVQLSPEQIIELVKRVVGAYKDIRQIFFVTDDFFLISGQGERFCELVIKEKAKKLLPENLKFICLTNITKVNRDNLRLMVQAGFRVLSIGVESTSQFVLDSLNKKQTESQIWEVTEQILEAGIKPYYTVLLFTPYCRVEDLLYDLKGFRKLSEMGAGLSLEPYLIPLPGTLLAEDRVPERTRWIDVTNGIRIKKGFAWLPIRRNVRKIFYKYEEIYPKFKSWRFDVDIQEHKEKNFQSLVMLDCLEFVLRKYFKYEISDSKLSDLDEIEQMLEKYQNVVNVDIVGDFIRNDDFVHEVGGM